MIPSRAADPDIPRGDQEPPLQGRFRHLQELARAVVDASRVRPGESVAGQPPNSTGTTLIRPGGRTSYPAFWIRDFTMSLGSGLITGPELRHALLLTARLQATVPRHTESGSLVPAGSIADHITFDGQAIFFPGSMDPMHQGRPFGDLPALDDHFYFIEMAWYMAVVYGDFAVLGTQFEEDRLIDRLDLAFDVPPAPDDTGLVWCEKDHRGVGFGFTDTVIHTGYHLFCSLLRHRAALRMAALHRRLGHRQQATHYRTIAHSIAVNIPSVFMSPSGLLRASTGMSAQPDVWGSAFAVYSGILTGSTAFAVASALTSALQRGTIAWNGHIRHVPTDADFSEDSAWEKTVGGVPKNRYQNGAYWGTPVGWVCFTVMHQDPELAQDLASEYLRALRDDDFRRGRDHGAPWECLHPGGDYRQNPVYMASITCPMEAFQQLGWLGP